MTLSDLVGKHILSGVSIGYAEKNELDNDSPVSVDFILDGKNVSVIEDPDDGYRSSMREVTVDRNGFACTNLFDAISVLGMRRADDQFGTNDVIDFIDISNGKIILSVGTGNTDDYYPYFVSSWIPENMFVNELSQARQDAEQ